MTESRKKNALTHGIYGKDLLLPWESREEFEKLLADLQAEVQPSGPMESESVFDLAHLRGQKKRVHQMWIAAAYADPFVSDLVETGERSWAGMRDRLEHKAKEKRTMSELLNESFLEQTAEAAKTLAELIQTDALTDSATKTSEMRKHEAHAFRNVAQGFAIPLLEAAKDRPNAQDSLRRAYSPEYLEPIIRLEAMIDARIDKALARLVNIKEYKRLAATYSPPLISANAPTSSNLNDGAAKSAVEHIMNNNWGE